MSGEDSKTEVLELISCDELAQLLHSGATQKVLIVDCRSFLEFNTGNIVNSVNVCCSKLVKRRLQQNKVPISEFLSSTCHVDAEKDHEIVLCDQCTTTPDVLADDNLVVILARRCRDAFRRVRLLVGGFLEFQATHPSLCETKSVLTQVPGAGSTLGHGTGMGADSRAGTPLSSGMTSSLSQPCLPVANVGPTKILPYLFLGSQQDAMSAEQAQINGITYVLNVSLNCPKPPHIQDGHFLRIPVNDNYSEKLLPYFHEAFQFLDKVREGGSRVLVHCLAGISRSPTLAIAYIMRCYHMTSDEAYRYVKDKRPTISPNFNFLGQLLEYERQIEAESTQTGGGHKRRCLDDLRSVGVLTPISASAPAVGGSLASSSPSCSPTTATPLAGVVTPLAVVATPMPSGPPSWCFPPQLQPPFSGDSMDGRQLGPAAATALESCCSLRPAVADAPTVQPLTRLQLHRAATLHFPPTCLPLIGGSGSGSTACWPQRPKQLSAAMPELTSAPPALSQQSPSSALANLRFESSLPVVADQPVAADEPSLPPPAFAEASPLATGSGAGAPVLRIGQFPTVSLSDLSFTPCLVAPATAATCATSVSSMLWSRGNTTFGEESGHTQGLQAAGQGNHGSPAFPATTAASMRSGSTTLRPSATDQARGAISSSGSVGVTGSLGRSRRLGMSLNLTPTVALTFTSANSLSSSAPQLLRPPLLPSHQPCLVDPSATRASAQAGRATGMRAGHSVRAASASPDLCGRPASAATADLSDVTYEPPEFMPSSTTAEPSCCSSVRQGVLPDACLPPGTVRQLPPQRPSSITILPCSQGSTCSSRSSVSTAAMDVDDGVSHLALPAFADGRVHPADDLGPRAAAACAASTMAGQPATVVAAAASAAVTALTPVLASDGCRGSCSIAAAAAAVGKMSSARTVPADLNSVVMSGEGRLWAGTLSEMSTHRKSRSLEDILLTSAPRYGDWDPAAVVDAGGSSRLEAEAVAAGACRCLRRRSAMLVFSGGEDGASTSVSVVASPLDRCRCGSTAMTTSVTSAGSSLPRPSSGSIASTSSSGGSRTASLHSSLEMIQVS